jgi:hypothetical protein
METGLTMLFHSVVIGIFLYFFMVFGLGQRNDIAENKSVLISVVVLIYMIVFGHGLPTKMNKSL